MTATPRARAHFADRQIAELRRLAVTTEQIEELERVLPGCRTMLGPVPRMADVREELQSLQRALRSASDALARFDAASCELPALNEAYHRLLVASWNPNTDGDGYVAEKAIRVLEEVFGWANVAIAELRPRKNEAPTWPIARIHEALVRGWGRTYYRVFHGTDERSTVDAAAPPPPPFPHVPSSGITSPFRQVVGICYEAVKAPNTDPEQQIRRYVRWHKARGQQALEKSSLPS